MDYVAAVMQKFQQKQNDAPAATPTPTKTEEVMADVKTIEDVFKEHNADGFETPSEGQGCRCVNCKAHAAGETGPAKSE